MTKLIIKLVVNLFLFLSLFLLIEAIPYALEIPHIASHRTSLKYDLLFDKIDKNTILIVGDSRAEWNIKPEIIDSILKVNNLNYHCINLSMPGSNGTDIVEKLKEYNKFPKLIIWGYSSFSYAWNGHHFETSTPNPLQLSNNYKNLFYEYIQNNSFLLENKFSSLSLYLKKETPYFLSHNYDQKGGVYVTESADSYLEREKYQLASYLQKIENNDKKKLEEYKSKMSKLTNHFKDSSLLLKIRFPVSSKMEKLELQIDSINTISLSKSSIPTLSYRNQEHSLENFNFDLTKDDIKEENIFMDGSHFTHRVAENFSIKLANYLCKDFLINSKL